MPILGALGAIVLLLVLVSLVLLGRSRSLSRRLSGLTRGEDGASLEGVLGSHLARVNDVVQDVDRLEARTVVLERDLKRALGRVALVRFNPFEDTGGNQSFALAVLDANGDGFVVSSLHARQGTRVYAKSVRGGRSEAALSGEEEQALRQALGAPATGTSG